MYLKVTKINSKILKVPPNLIFWAQNARLKVWIVNFKVKKLFDEKINQKFELDGWILPNFSSVNEYRKKFEGNV